jgi:hypothetical protein
MDGTFGQQAAGRYFIMTMTTNTTSKASHPNGKLTARELEASVGTLPVLGYSVQWNLSQVEIAQHELVKALAQVGFATTHPERPSPTTALRRALARWLHQQAATELDAALEFELDGEDGTGEDVSQDKGKGHPRARKNLIRKINSPHSDWLVFGLVVEQLDLAALGLSYATQLRIFMHKKTLMLKVSQTEAGLEPDDLSEDAEEQNELEPELATITLELRQLFDYYREHHQARDISRLLKQLVGGLDSFALRRLGGVYFVPQQHRVALDNLQKLVDELPATAGYVSDKFMLKLPILDGEGAKKQLAQAAHRDFMQELASMQTDLDHLTDEATHHQLRSETVARRLTTYRELKAKAEVYAELLDMQQSRILRAVTQLTEQAASLLDNLTDFTPAPVGQQQAFDWDNPNPPQIQEHIDLSVTSV